MDKKRNLKKPNVSNSKQKQKPKFIMPRYVKQKITIILTSGLLLSSLYNTAQAKSANVYTVGVPNHDATITVNGEDIKIDPNSFVIASETSALAYDESGNILKGVIDDTDFEKVFQLTESQMSNYNVYQVISESGVNVRSSGEIQDGNIISTVPSLDYVLGYATDTPEYDGEWVSTLSINGNEIHNGYIREDNIKEVGSFEDIYNRDDVSLQDTEKMMIVNTSQDGGISLNLRSMPETSNKENILTKIPNGSTVKIIGENINSDNRNWSRIIYETTDGNTFEGWVATNYLTSNIVKQQVQEVKQNDIQNTENRMQVNTSQDGNIDLNLRSTPETSNKENILTKIPNGSFVKVIGETIQSGNRNWSQVVYESADGNIFEGWVATNYLTSTLVEQPTEQIQTNKSGSITGIDISSMSPEELRELLQNGIPNSVKANIRKC